MKDEEEKKNTKEGGESIMYAKGKPVQYYVNYLNEARRMDRWVEENMVRIDDEKVEVLHEEFKMKEAIEQEERKN